MSQSIKYKHQRLLLTSIVISILLHAAELHFLQRQALWFSSPMQIESEEASWSSSMEKQTRTQILKESFTTSAISSSSYAKERTKAPQGASMEIAQEVIATFHAPSPEIELSSLQPLSASLASYHLPPIEHVFSIPRIDAELPHTPLEPSLNKDPTKMAFCAPSMTIARSPIEGTQISWQPTIKQTKSSHLTHTLPKLPSLSDLQTIPYSSFFDTELVFCEIEEGNYFFALTLIPKPTLKLTPFKQNYFFLIDRSNSIQRERLASTKQAVHKALEQLAPGDRFNIFVFDQKLEKLSTAPLSISTESITKARKFLDKIELGSFFSQTNLYKPLASTLPPIESEDELNTAILISDGASLSQPHEIYDLSNQWTQYNQGKTSLYTLGLSTDKNLQRLHTISHLNRGNVTTAPTNKGIKRKLLKLLKTIHVPVAKNLSCRAISKSASSHVEILPQNIQAPHLYLQEPYTILGTTKTLDDFVLFVQGRLNGKWLHIKKQISFLNAKKGDASLQTDWAEHKALALYQQYLQNQNPNLLMQAQQLLAQHDLPGIVE